MSPMVPGFTDHDGADSSILHDGKDSAIRRTDRSRAWIWK